ncbi:MAG TPA: lysine--tRNA ligase [Myxococcota bacterium]|nr:lysine--tRNA ligase [Myxococcota bacterium]
MATETEILAARRKAADELRARGVDLFPARVPRDRTAIPELLARFGTADAAALEQADVSTCVAGRIVALRSFGKMAFATVQGDGERLQLWVRKDNLAAEAWQAFQSYEVGDFVFGRGKLVRTQKGELSLEVRELGFLAKSYRPLPEKWHGLQDVEARYRQRYLDVLTNPESRRAFVIRSRMISAMREYLDRRGFLEVETPVLQPIYGGAHARPFTTLHNTYDQELFLRISFELYLKRLIVGGFDRVYEIGRDFRNEGVDRKHNPEFTMLEVYQAYADYHDMMELVENMVALCAERALGTPKIERDGVKIDLSQPWPRRSMTELIRDACGIDIGKSKDLESLRAAVKAQRVPNVDLETANTWAGLVDAVFSETVEPSLVAPTFVVDYPAALSPLAKRDPTHPEMVERFEGFIGGMEICNAFSELNDPDDQRVRFEEQAEASRRGDEGAQPLDEDFLRALEHGMPPTGGMGLGVGRLAMILTGASHLREVKLFPHLRPRDD